MNLSELYRKTANKIAVCNHNITLGDYLGYRKDRSIPMFVFSNFYLDLEKDVLWCESNLHRAIALDLLAEILENK